MEKFRELTIDEKIFVNGGMDTVSNTMNEISNSWWGKAINAASQVSDFVSGFADGFVHGFKETI